MILRIWHGRVHTSNAPAYRAFLNERALPDYRATAGNLAVYIVEQKAEDVTHVLTLSLWTDRDAIVRFAGAEIEEAKYYPEDRAFLLEFEPRVQHYDIVGHAVDVQTGTNHR